MLDVGRQAVKSEAEVSVKRAGQGGSCPVHKCEVRYGGMTGQGTKSALSIEFTKRIEEMAVSRSEFARASRISRQTLYNIEVLGWVSLRDTTYVLLDKHLHWPSGTARALAHGEIEHAPVADDLTQQQRDDALRWEIAQYLNDCATESLLKLLTAARACKGDPQQPSPITDNERTHIA